MTEQPKIITVTIPELGIALHLTDYDLDVRNGLRDVPPEQHRDLGVREIEYDGFVTIAISGRRLEGDRDSAAAGNGPKTENGKPGPAEVSNREKD